MFTRFRAEWQRRGALMTEDDRAVVREIWIRLGCMVVVGLLGATIGTFVDPLVGLVLIVAAVAGTGVWFLGRGVAVLRGEPWVRDG